MVSIGGNIRPHVGDSAIQNISGRAAMVMSADSHLALDTSGVAAGGVGGVTLSGNFLNRHDGFIEAAFSGTKIWIPYWVSA